MPEALIIDACRTPCGIGKVGKGALAEGLNTAEVNDIDGMAPAIVIERV